MSSKPTVTLLTFGTLCYHWYQSLSPKDPYSFESWEHEGEARRYRLLFHMGSPERFGGVLLMLSFHELLSDDLRAILLLASRYTQELCILVCDTRGKSDEERDEEEEGLREDIAELGFQADNALFFYEPEPLPTKEAIAALSAKLDDRAALLRPNTEPTPLPECKDKKLAEFFSLAKELVLPATLLSLTKSSAAALQKLPISTQFGGMPYLEQGEDWPICKSCPAALRFLFQLDAAQDLRPAVEGAGLFTFYACGGALHLMEQPLIINRHYLSPDPQKRQAARSEATRTFASTKAPVSPCTVKRITELQFPSLDALEALSQNPEFQGTPPDGFFRRLGLFIGIESRLLDYERTYEGVYEKARDNMGAATLKFQFDREQPLQLGGYSDLASGRPIPRCKRCKRVLRTLANIHEAKGLGFPFRKRTALQFFLCPCQPSTVHTVIRTESQSERYDRIYE